MSKITEVRMPAGDYYVGDPCYAVPNDRWMEWLEAADFMACTGRDELLVAELDGKTIVGVSTAYGDGLYPGSDGGEYPVDAGLLGVTPVEVATETPFGSRRVTFTEDFICRYDDGTVILGSIEIDTDPEEG